MRRAVALLAFVAVSVGAPAAGSDPQPTPATNATPAVRAVVATQVKYPKRVTVKHSRFRPWEHPSVAQAHRIAAIEAARWGVSLPGLENRISCESTWQWYNEYPVYHGINPHGHYGLGQFLPSTWDRAVGSMFDRHVRLIERRWYWRHVVTTTTWSDGTVVRHLGRRVHVVMIHVLRGLLPRRPSIWHGWAQIRAVAQALAGRSAVGSGEWSCAA